MRGFEGGGFFLFLSVLLVLLVLLFSLLSLILPRPFFSPFSPPSLQVRLVLAKKDFIRAYIVAQKVNRKVLSEPGFAALKVRFYTLLAEYHRSQKDARELCVCYEQIYGAVKGGEDEGKWKEALEATVLFLVSLVLFLL